MSHSQIIPEICNEFMLHYLARWSDFEVPSETECFELTEHMTEWLHFNGFVKSRLLRL